MANLWRAERVTPLRQTLIYRLFDAIPLPLSYHTYRLIGQVFAAIWRSCSLWDTWLFLFMVGRLERDVHVRSLSCGHLGLKGQRGVRLMIVRSVRFTSCVALVEHLQVKLWCTSLDHVGRAIAACIHKRCHRVLLYALTSHQIIFYDQVRRACCLCASFAKDSSRCVWNFRPVSIWLRNLRLELAVSRTDGSLQIWGSSGLAYDIWIDRGHFDKLEYIWR